MTDWKQKAEQFAIARRHLKLDDPIAMQAGICLGVVLRLLAAEDETPERLDELRRLTKAFQDALGK